jgi:plasmid stabilization system protein ParE
MPRRVDLLAEAEADLDAARAWYFDQSFSAGDLFSAEIDAAFEKIISAPDRWARVASGIHRYRVPGFPYVIVYRFTDDAITVVAVAHTSRRPGYWRGRE